jgi:tetratricopeptide (TPR) repeat protein
VFNLAKCAEDEGNLEEASRLLDQYLALAPEAVDGAETKTDVEEVRELERRAGPEVVTLYGEADRAARKGQYKRAIDALTRAAEKAPQLAETQVKLARLHQGAGNIEAARTHYQKYLSLETRPALVAPVRDEIGALEKRAAEYQALVDPARERLLTWMHRYVVDGRPMGSAASTDELKSIAEQLQKAAVMMPLGTELNRMLGTIYLIDGNYGPARKAFGAVAEAGEPIWFYATANGVNGWEKNILAKVEVHGRKIRVLGVTKIDKKGFVALTDGSTPSARLAGFLTPAHQPAAGSKTPFLEIASVSNAETDDDSVRLTWSDDPAAASAAKREVRLTPFRFTNTAPASGPPSRRFANPYTKLFRDFADVQVKLGAERMTGGEKFGFAMQMAAAAYAGGAMALAGGAYSTANIVAAAMRSATWATIELQNAMDRQARMFQETQFKIMPLEDPKPVFRKDALR